MTPPVTFDACSPDDHAALHRLVAALYAEDPGGEPMHAAKLDRTIATFTADPARGRIVIFRAGDERVGYALLQRRWSNEHGGDLAVVDELYVVPAWRGRGVASGFMAAVPGLAGGEVVGVVLEVGPDNAAALAFYRRLGFRDSPNLHLFLSAGADGGG